MLLLTLYSRARANSKKLPATPQRKQDAGARAHESVMYIGFSSSSSFCLWIDARGRLDAVLSIITRVESCPCTGYEWKRSASEIALVYVCGLMCSRRLLLSRAREKNFPFEWRICGVISLFFILHKAGEPEKLTIRNFRTIINGRAFNCAPVDNKVR